MVKLMNLTLSIRHDETEAEYATWPNSFNAWWVNFIVTTLSTIPEFGGNQRSEEYDCYRLGYLIGRLAEWKCDVNFIPNSINSLQFKTEHDMVNFLLRWS